MEDLLHYDSLGDRACSGLLGAYSGSGYGSFLTYVAYGCFRSVVSWFFLYCYVLLLFPYCCGLWLVPYRCDFWLYPFHVVSLPKPCACWCFPTYLHVFVLLKHCRAPLISCLSMWCAERIFISIPYFLFITMYLIGVFKMLIITFRTLFFHLFSYGYL